MAFLGDDGSALPGWNSQSFPSIDPRIGWAVTMLCLLIALLLTLGVLRIQIGSLTGATWVAIVCAQVVTAAAVALATHFSTRKRSGAETARAAQETSSAPEA
jgi:hypothetical protein